MSTYLPPATGRLAALVAGVAILVAAFTGTTPDDDAMAGTSEAPAPVTAPAPGDPASPGVSDDRVLFGQSAAFSGPAQALGHAMRLGIEAAFAE